MHRHEARHGSHKLRIIVVFQEMTSRGALPNAVEVVDGLGVLVRMGDPDEARVHD
jgi:hypothetical protein